jgi:hypothetical protein
METPFIARYIRDQSCRADKFQISGKSSRWRNHLARQAFNLPVITGFLRVPSVTTGISWDKRMKVQSRGSISDKSGETEKPIDQDGRRKNL